MTSCRGIKNVLQFFSDIEYVTQHEPVRQDILGPIIWIMGLPITLGLRDALPTARACDTQGILGPFTGGLLRGRVCTCSEDILRPVIELVEVVRRRTSVVE